MGWFEFQARASCCCFAWMYMAPLLELCAAIPRTGDCLPLIRDCFLSADVKCVATGLYLLVLTESRPVYVAPLHSTAQLSPVVKICSCALLADTWHCIADTWHSLRFVSGAGVAWSMRWRRCPRLSSVRKTHKSIAPCRAKTDHSFAETGSGQT